VTIQERTKRPEPLVIATELSVLLVTIAATAGYSRLFTDRDWIAPLMVAAVSAHLVMAVARRLRRGLLFAGAAGFIVMALEVTWTHYRSTTSAGLPSRATRDALDADLETAWTLFSNVTAPTPSATGFIVLATVATWLIAYLADWAAFRLWSPLATMLPSFAMFVFIAFFGTTPDRIALAGLYAAALIVFVLLHHMVRQAHEVRWLAGSETPGTTSLLGTGAMVSVIVVVGAMVLGPAIPGAERQALLGLEAGGKDATRVVQSPFVDIRGRLVNLPEVEAFTVRSERPSYWRLASLDNFDGAIWGTTELSYRSASDGLTDTVPPGTEAFNVRQRFEIKAMGNFWLPAAPEPVAIPRLGGFDDISYESVSGTLLAVANLASTDNLTYEVVSKLPLYDAGTLAAINTVLPNDIAAKYLPLPADFSPTAAAMAAELTAGLDNTYDKALALQSYFRSFTYDLNVGPKSDIDAFLIGRRGYCEQFAGSFAAMARSLGIPARVAVGFTQGTVDSNDPNLYHVLGEHAHAWPEVYFAGAGWVPFEPTPTRGAPNAPWTNVQAQQSGEDRPFEAPQPTSAPLSATEDPLGAFDPEFEPPVETPVGSPSGSPEASTSPWLKTPLVLGLLVAAVAAYAGLMIAAKRWKAHRRVATAVDDRERVGAIWHNAVDALEPMGLLHGSSETPDEFASRAARVAGTAGPSLIELGHDTTTAMCAPEPPGPDDVMGAQERHDEIVAEVSQQIAPVTRIKAILDPRPLVRK
jgi:transglutaminase-like putative cysteine protease